MLNEDGAPTVNIGGGDVAGVGVSKAGKPANWGEPGRNPSLIPMQRRRKPNFAGAAVFEVTSNVFHSARLEKRKGKHWRKYLEEDDSLAEIREYANKNPHKPIILRNENTGAMCYARYGRKGY